MSDLDRILSDYPLYLRWGQMVDLHKRLGLGSERIVKRALREGRIERVRLTGKRDHYTRSSVAQLACPKSGTVGNA